MREGNRQQKLNQNYCKTSVAKSDATRPNCENKNLGLNGGKAMREAKTEPKR